MRVMKARDQQPLSPLVCFCEVVARDPFFLVGTADHIGFQLTDLPQLRLATVSEVPTPWMCLQHDLREQGLDPGKLERLADRAMAENFSALREKRLDVVQVFEPFVSMALQEGIGSVLYAASERGPTVYTSFIATRELIARNGARFRRHGARCRACAGPARRSGPGRLGSGHCALLSRRSARYSHKFPASLRQLRHLGRQSGDLAARIFPARRKPGQRWIPIAPATLRGLRPSGRAPVASGKVLTSAGEHADLPVAKARRARTERSARMSRENIARSCSIRPSRDEACTTHWASTGTDGCRR